MYFAYHINYYEFIIAEETDDEDFERGGNVDVPQELEADEGEGIDLLIPRDELDLDDNKYYAEGKCGNLHDNEGETSRWIEF